MSAGSTIYALATPLGKSAVAVIRMSGPQTREVLTRLGVRGLAPRAATLTAFRDGAGAVIDRGLALWFPAPASVTGEDCAELHCHGGAGVRRAMLAALARLPQCRMAQAGEFTARAFANGKLDLAAVEGLADLIDAETELQRAMALRQLGGALDAHARAWRAALLDILALVEADHDFSEEDDVGLLDKVDVAAMTQRVADDITAALEASGRGERIRNGFRVVLAGPPNAGKSSLLNALAKRDVAIVSPHPGTTRDAVEVALDLDGALVLLTDTAGLRDSSDPVEREGVERALHHAQQADLVLWLSAAHEPPPVSLEARHVLRVASKCDERPLDAADIGLPVSVVTGEGLTAVIETITREATEGIATAAPPLLTQERHIEAARDALHHLAALQREGWAASECAALHVRLAADAIGRIAGRIGVEDVLGAIFSRFCIGK